MNREEREEKYRQEYLEVGVSFEETSTLVQGMELASRIEYARLIRIAKQIPKRLFRIEKNISDIREVMKKQEKDVFKLMLWFGGCSGVLLLGAYFFTESGKLPDAVGWVAAIFWFGFIVYPHLKTKFNEHKFQKEIDNKERYEYEWFSTGLSNELLGMGLYEAKRREEGKNEDEMKKLGKEDLEEHQAQSYLISKKYALSVMIECKNLASGEVKDYWSI